MKSRDVRYNIFWGIHVIYNIIEIYWCLLLHCDFLGGVFVVLVADLNCVRLHMIKEVLAFGKHMATEIAAMLNAACMNWDVMFKTVGA